MTGQEKLEWIDEILEVVKDLKAKKLDPDFSEEEFAELENDVKLWLADGIYNFCKHEHVNTPTEAECKKEERGNGVAQCLTCGDTTACWYVDGEDGREVEYNDDWIPDYEYIKDRTVLRLATTLSDFIRWDDEV